jgi:hypothetical protein
VIAQESGADQSNDEKLRAPSARLSVARGKQRQQCDAAFAAVVCSQDQHHAFERDDQDQPPQDQRHHIVDGLMRHDSVTGYGLDRFLQRIEGAGAVVAVDDAEGAVRRVNGIAVGYSDPSTSAPAIPQLIIGWRATLYAYSFIRGS